MSDDRRRTGGVDGVTARYADMRRSGDLLMGISSTFLADAATIGGYATDRDLLSSAVFAPGEAVQVETRLAGIGLGLGADAARLGALGTFLVGAVDAYQLADEAMAAIETGAANAVTFSLGYATPAILLIGGSQFLQEAGIAWGIGQVRGFFDPDFRPSSYTDILKGQGGDMLTWLQQHPQVADLLTRGSPGLVNGLASSPVVGGLADLLTLGALRRDRPLTYDQAVATILGIGSTYGFFNDGSISVRPVVEADGNPEKIEPSKDLRGIFDSLHQLDEFDQDDGDREKSDDPEYSRIRVVQSVGDDGVTRWIVQIPSTQSWDPHAGSAANDVTACLVEMGDRPSALEAAVRQAMDQAGIAPGDPVMLTGFSLGGITAGSLAADPSFTSTYNVQAVLTAGSPIARFDIGSDIQVLSIEHADDLVPHLDGLDNPDRTSWTTVTDTTPFIQKPGADSGVGIGAHDTRTYAETADDIQKSGDPSVDHYMSTVAPFLDGDQTVTDFRAERVH